MQINCFNFRLNCVKGLEVNKTDKEFKFEWTCAKLRGKNCFQRQPWTKPLRQTLASMWNCALREKFNFYFSVVFCHNHVHNILRHFDRRAIFFHHKWKEAWLLVISMVITSCLTSCFSPPHFRRWGGPLCPHKKKKKT